MAQSALRCLVAVLVVCANAVGSTTLVGQSQALPPVFLALGLIGATSAAAQTPAAEIDGSWRAAPGDVGLDHGRLETMTAAIRRQEYAGIHALLIERNGRLVYEEYFEGEDVQAGHGSLGHVVFDAETRHDLRSVTKSVVAALVGIALESGAIRSLDQPLFDFFPEHVDLSTPEKRTITLRHALTMSAGLEWDENISYADTRNDEIGMNRSDDPVRYVLGRPVVAGPGTTWNYNGGLTQLLAVVLERSSGQPLLEYAREELFDPLGITDVEWPVRLGGLPSAASGLRLRPRDLARFGSLYGNAGRWQDRQILPAEWVSESTLRRLAVADSIWELGETGYGYQWWHDRFTTSAGPIESFTAAGNGGQRIFVLPDLGMVVTMLGGRYNQSGDWTAERLLLEQIVPAVVTPAQSTSRASLRVGDIHAAPGSKVSGQLRVPMADGEVTEIPVSVVNSPVPGLVLALIAGTHGTEYTPILALRQLIHELDPEAIRGAVILVHMANPIASYARRLAEGDPDDLNESFPGDPEGTPSERIALALSRDVIEQATHVIDMHAGDGNERLDAYAYLILTGDSALDTATRDLVLAYGMDRIVVDTDMYANRERTRHFTDSYALSLGKPAFLPEFGGSMTTDAEHIQRHVNGVWSVMARLGMSDGEVLEPAAPFFFHESQELRADRSGLWHPLVSVRQVVDAGAVRGRITDPSGGVLQEVRAPYHGEILTVVGTPPVNRGEAAVFIGRRAVPALVEQDGSQ